MNRRLVGTGLAIGLVAGAGAGFALEMAGSAGASSGAAVAIRAAVANATTDTTPPSDSTAPSDSTVPGNPAAPTSPARPDPTTQLQKVLQPLIDDGTITQAQADKVIAAIVAARPSGPMGGDRHIMKGLGGFALDTVANALGITTDEVRTALQSGQSLADLAVSKGKTAKDVIDAIVAEATTKINAEVTAKHLDQATADKILANLQTLATDVVNNTPAAGGPGLGGPGMGRGFGGPFLGGPGLGGPGHRGNDNDADDGTSGSAPSDTTAPTVAG